MIIAYAPGYWDGLHVGHLYLLRSAKRLCDKLVVGIASDLVIEINEGVPPTVSAKERRELMSELVCVDVVDIYDDINFQTHLHRYTPNIVVIGLTDWSNFGVMRDAENWANGDNRRRLVRLPRVEGISPPITRKWYMHDNSRIGKSNCGVRERPESRKGSQNGSMGAVDQAAHPNSGKNHQSQNAGDSASKSIE